MKTLHLLRHAKSDWENDALGDHERPLAPRGVKAARRLAEHLGQHPLQLDLVLCSTATRTRQTLELILPALGAVDVSFEDDLYGAGAGDLQVRLRRLPRSVNAVLVIGHNPGLEELASLLLGPAAPGHFPTLALASLEFAEADWRSLRDGIAKPTGFITPKET